MQPASQNNQRGVIAIFLATILAVLLLTTTTYAARVSVSELDQSSQIDRSEQAYYAAEAGVEDAIRRINQAPQGTTIANIFPQQFGCASTPCNNTTQPGDTYSLTGDGASSIVTDSGSSNGSISWRHRRVYQDTSSFFGTIVKDQTEQFDMTDLCRRINGFVYGSASCPPNNAGTQPAGKDFDGSDIFGKLTGLQFCWKDSVPSAELEITDISYPAGSPGNSSTTKYLAVGAGSVVAGQTVTTAAAAGVSGYQYCLTFPVSSATRHILRFKTLVTGLGAAGAGNGDQYFVTFHAQLVESPAQPVGKRLYLPNQSYLIDVVGESGDIHRRVVARKLVNGKILGVFDYVLYSGDPLKDLCKIGVNQSDSTQGDISYDPFNCGGVTSTNNDTVGAPSQRLEGESFAPQTWDRVVLNDGAASAGQLMGLFTTAGVCKTVNTGAFSSLTVRAYEWQYQGVDANMVVTVDGATAFDGSVTYTSWGNVDVPTTGSAGSHTFCFNMTNDGYQNPGGPGNDRNLFVDYIDVNP